MMELVVLHASRVRFLVTFDSKSRGVPYGRVRIPPNHAVTDAGWILDARNQVVTRVHGEIIGTYEDEDEARRVAAELNKLAEVHGS